MNMELAEPFPEELRFRTNLSRPEKTDKLLSFNENLMVTVLSKNQKESILVVLVITKEKNTWFRK
jgi:hypothetical protein